MHNKLNFVNKAMKITLYKLAIIFGVITLVLLLILVAGAISYGSYKNVSPKKLIVMDVGSTKTRAYLFNWNNPNTTFSAELLGSYKCGDAINNLINNTELLHNYFSSCMIELNKTVSAFNYANTYTYVGATGGIRLHCPDDPKYCETYKNNTEFVLKKIGFPTKQLHVEVLTGLYESLYGFLSANDFLGSFENTMELKGTIDLGGATFEVAFEIKNEQQMHSKSNIKEITVSEQKFKTFLQEVDCIGAKSARLIYDYNLLNEPTFSDPCLPLNYKMGRKILDYDNACLKDQLGEYNAPKYRTNVTFIGTSNVTECIEKLGIIFGDSAQCVKPSMCLKNKIISAKQMGFIGLSAFQYTALDFGLTNISNLKNYYDIFMERCFTTQKEYSKYCFQHIYSYFLLKNVMELRDEQLTFITTKEIIGWPSGKAFSLKNIDDVKISVRVLNANSFTVIWITCVVLVVACSIIVTIFVLKGYKKSNVSDFP